MKKVYNYRNTTNINCGVYNCPIGIRYEDYPQINEMRKELKLNPTTSRHWAFYEDYDNGYYRLNVDFNEQKLSFETNPSRRPVAGKYRMYQWYYHVEEKCVGIKRHFNNGYFFDSGNMAFKGEMYLVPIDVKTVDFNISIKDITSMEVISKWWSSKIYIKLNFNKILHNGVDEMKLEFDKSDKEDANFVVDEINTIRRMIQSKEQEKILERWEEIE